MRSPSFRIGIVTTLFSTFAVSAHAAHYSIQDKLDAFKSNPKAFMSDQGNVQKYLQKYVVTKQDEKTREPIEWQLIAEDQLPIGSEAKFSGDSLGNKDFISQKNSFHEGLGQKASEITREGRAMIDRSTDNPEALVDKLKITKLKDMEGHLQAGTVAESPWSGDYWAIYTGMLAKRYADPNFPASTDWKENAEYINGTGSCTVDHLSPAEKYDLLVGDETKSLTKAMLAEGQSYFEKSGKVETWMGICHGWAPAAFMEHRPSHAIEVTAADKKTKIKFYPSDIKALASLLWAKTSTDSKFIGTRCGIKNPPTDPENGRILAKECFDTNPGTWHLAVVNQIGVKKRSFVLDATYDYEVWNQPAYSYEYTYFNPKTNQPVRRMSDGIVSLGDPDFNDTFKKYRDNPEATSVVGIAMKFVYIAETRPSTDDKDSDGHDRRVAVNYLYDLELDKDGQIVGGEWYHQQHPDFLWTPTEGAKALSVGDQFLSSKHDKSTWQDRQHTSMPEIWQEAALKGSGRGQPLAKVVKELIQKSNQVDLGFFRINWPGTRD